MPAKITSFLAAAMVLMSGRVWAADAFPAPDLTKDRALYWVGYTHLDTQWRWTYPTVINEFLVNTVHDNLPLLEKYPHYIFNFTGANRYRLIKEYNPADFALIKQWVAKGQWFPAGSSWEENDVNVPAEESLVRQILFGHDFFKKEFGTESDEYMLPDCFGFPASLPSILAHCGIRGFSTQKLAGWDSAVGVPFDIGTWQGPDGNSIIAVLNAGSYGAHVNGDYSVNKDLADYLDRERSSNKLAALYYYYGKGDTGGAPDEQSVSWVERTAGTSNLVRIVSARSDQMFRDISDAQMAQLPKYKGDLLLTEHSAGSITSEAYMKQWNHENEKLAGAAESAAVAASLLGAIPYPREKLHRAWELVLGGQFHDLLPGTALPKAFEYTWNDENIAMNTFAGVLQDSVGAVARGLDTRGEGTPLVVFNPLSVAREDVVEAELEFPGVPAGVAVTDGEGKAVGSQLVSTSGGKTHFLFLAKAPALGYAVYLAKALATAEDSKASSLKVNEHSLENGRYRVGLSQGGDITNIFDKAAGKEILFKPVRLAFLTEKPADFKGLAQPMQFPAWEMYWADRRNPPRSHVEGPAKFKVVENGPVRVAVEVQREAEGSSFTQTVRLAAGAAGDRVEIANVIYWQTKAASLKVEFPLTVTNSHATYNWELGKIERGNNDPKKFEVPSHQWFDLTDKSGDYGVSILTGSKYGSDKPADVLLRLTLLYSPGVTQPFYEQRWQDWGRHEFVYGIYGHKNDWRGGGSDWQAARLDQPLMAFRTSAHDGKLERSFSVLKVGSEAVAVRALKLAENGEQVIVRLQELNGAEEKGVTLSPAAALSGVAEVNGVETVLHPVDVVGGALKLDFKPYQLRSLALNLASATKLTPTVSMPVELPFNVDVFSAPGEANDGAFDAAGRTLAADMIGDVVTSGGVDFKIGPRGKGQSNSVACHGQTITLPAGAHNRLYLLAAADGDTTGEFKVDGKTVTLGVQDWGGYIGQWDNRVFKGVVKETEFVVTNDLDHIDAGFIKRDSIAWFSDHRHAQDGSNEAYRYSYLFKYWLDVGGDAKTLTLPDNPRIRVFAVTVAQNDNDEAVAVHPLYDDFTGRKPITLRADH